MPDSPPRSLGEALQRLRQLLSAADPERAEPLLLGLLELPRSRLFSRPESPLGADDWPRVEAAAARLLGGEPLAYVLGTQGFWTFDLEVGPDVLIPRPDTEVLVDAALQRLPVGAAARVVDLGTGSGAVALALARERPSAQVLAVERSLPALAVARRNARRHALANLDFLAADWLSALSGRFDLVVSNPPYLAKDDPHLGRDGLQYEPQAALVSGADGLDAIRAIAEQARAVLQPGGWLLLEHGWEQGEAVREVLGEWGYRERFIARDLAGRDRVSGGLRPA